MKRLNLPVLLIAIILGTLLFERWLPVAVKAGLYTLSLQIKEALLFCLPFILFAFLFNSFSKLRHQALLFSGILLGLICVSNFCAAQVSFFSGMQTVSKLKYLAEIPSGGVSLSPWFFYTLPIWCKTNMALCLGAFLGWCSTWLPEKPVLAVSDRLLQVAHFLLKKLFMPLLPLFILGFSLKLSYEYPFKALLCQYTGVLAVIFGVALLYLGGVYFLCAKGGGKRFAALLGNLCPAAITGFSTMSSALALPYLIEGSAKNIGDEHTPRSVLPITVNVHLLGDCIFLPIMSIAILLSFGKPLPTYGEFLVFSVYFVIAKFAVVAVPAGGVLVLLPLLEQYLGFEPHMIHLITALYMLLDPVITTGNVMGNGAFVMVFNRVYKRAVRLLSGGVEKKASGQRTSDHMITE